MSAIAIIQTAATLLPVLFKVVQGVEAVHTTYTGGQKKALALVLVEMLYRATDPVIPYEALAPHVGNAIDTTVQEYNENGQFVKTAVTEAA
jgi:hypothetical protein